MTVEEALVRLLAGSGLRARFTSGGAIVITPEAAPTMTLSPLHVAGGSRLAGPDARFLAYVAVVQRDLDALLQANDVAKGSYKIRLKIWLDRAGTVARSEVIASSGRSDRDAAFALALSGAHISEPPPEDLPEPLSIEFQVR